MNKETISYTSIMPIKPEYHKFIRREYVKKFPKLISVSEFLNCIQSTTDESKKVKKSWETMLRYTNYCQ